MKKLILIPIISIFFSCVVEENESSIPPEPETVEIEIPSDNLELEHISLDVYFYNTSNNNRFLGINNNVEVVIPVSLNSDFDIPEDTYGFNAYAETLIQVNNRYDLIKGTVTKFLNPQNIVRNDTIFSTQGFSEQTNGEYLLFDKQTFNFIELEEGFYIANQLYNPIQVIDNKMYYIKNIPSNPMSEIKYIDLENIDATPQSLHTSEHIVWFLINQQMDLYIRAGSSFQNKYIHNSTGQELEFFDANNPLKSHFVGIDGNFYAQNYFANLEQWVKGFYSLDIQENTVIGTEIFSFNDDDYPGISFLGDSDIVIPNYSRNNNLIIGTNTGVNSMYIYELNTSLGSINQLDINLNGLGYVNYYQDDFFVLTDFSNSSGNYRLRKFDLSNFTTLAEFDLGQSENGIIINNNNGSVFSLKTEGDTVKFIELKIDNTVTEIDLTYNQYGYFSIIE
jgi:hypothetical protein